MVDIDQPVFAARPPDQPVLQMLQWDAVDLLVRAAVINYTRLVAVGAEHTRVAAETGGVAAHPLIIAMNADALAFIGNVERLRKLMHGLGRDDEFRAAKRALLVTVSQYEAARHHIEHLDSTLKKLVDTADQALMAVSWQTPNEATSGVTYTFSMPGSAREGGVSAALKVSPVRAPADNFRVRVAGADYDLTAAHDAVQAFWERMRAWSAQWLTSDHDSGAS